MDTFVQHEVKKIDKLPMSEAQKTQKPLVCIGLSCSGFSFYEDFNRQFTYAVFLIFKTGRCV